ncbi:hypothetical protein [Natrinema altunense]|uniref:Uncharacterized protein n=1 Tax=Natrinema altunense (strain JCM 12890 / CGMCC 1.3731 / AJ2) TaxID=1227494 RepID=L9ZG40_NATA2|nr:hypothetical protein [Natrinema altunense]ELY84153.1 hypothetical protein C485_16950 [Natrinema altunense JCM 12890]
MAVGLLFGGFWLGLGILMWWWPAAIFVAFDNDDVTPGARAFAIGAMFFGILLLAMDIPSLTIDYSMPATVSLVGMLLLVKPVNILGVNADGRIAPQRAGVALLVGGVVIAVLT